MAEGRLIGVDPAPTVGQSGAAGNVKQPNLQVADSIWNRTAETNVAASQAKVQEASALGQQRVAEIAGQQRTGGGSGESFKNLAAGVIAGLQTFQEIKGQRAEAEAAQRELQGEANLAQALTEAADLIAVSEIQLQDSADEDGALTVQRRLLDIGMNTDLSPQQRQEFTKWVYNSMENYRRDYIGRLGRQRSDLQGARIDAIQSQAALELGTLTANLNGNIDTAETNAILGEAYAYIQQVVVGTEGMTLEEQFSMQSFLLQTITPNVLDNAEALQSIENQVEQTDAFLAEVAGLRQLVADGVLSPQDFNASVQQLQSRLPSNIATPESLLDQMQEAESTERVLNSLQELRTPEATPVSNILMGSLLIQVAQGTDPTVFGTQENAVRSAWTTVQGAWDEKVSLERRIEGLQADVATAQRRLPTIQAELGILRRYQNGEIDINTVSNPQRLRDIVERASEIEENYATVTTTIESSSRQLTSETRRLQEQVRLLQTYGLQGGLRDADAYAAYIETPEVQAQIQRATTALAAQQTANADFSQGGSDVPSPAPLAQVSRTQGSNEADWNGVYVPFAAGQEVVVTSGYGWRPSTNSQHNGIDFGMPAGTPIAAARSGTVTRNWYDGTNGNAISVTHADGSESTYIHMNERSPVAVGTRVGQGSTIGGVGNTGRSNGNHLHFSVKDEPGGNFLDPHEWLSETGVEQHWRSGYTVASPGIQSNTAVRGTNQTVVPQGSMQLPSGFQLRDGLIYTPSGLTLTPQTGGNRPAWRSMPALQGSANPQNVTGWSEEGVPAQQIHNAANPVAGAMSSNQRSAYPPNSDPTAHYGYAFFRDNPHAARKLAQVADAVGVPAVWLADVMAFETGGTFNPAEPEKGGSGAIGLIQFYPGGGLAEVAQWMGVSESVASTRLEAMSFVEQMDYVQWYLSGYGGRDDTQFVGRYDTIDRLLAAVFRGKPDAFNRPFEEIVNISDGQITVGGYTQRLGNAAGRRYYTIYDRMTGTRVHEAFRQGCNTCRAMQNAGGVVAHVDPNN